MKFKKTCLELIIAILVLLFATTTISAQSSMIDGYTPQNVEYKKITLYEYESDDFKVISFRKVLNERGTIVSAHFSHEVLLDITYFDSIMEDHVTLKFRIPYSILRTKDDGKIVDSGILRDYQLKVYSYKYDSDNGLYITDDERNLMIHLSNN